MIKYLKDLFKCCDHNWEVIGDNNNYKQISPNTLIISMCTKCQKLKYEKFDVRHERIKL